MGSRSERAAEIQTAGRRRQRYPYSPYDDFGAAAGVSEEPEMAWIGPLFGVAAIVVLPVLYAVIAFVMGVVVGGLYNLIAGKIGGIEVTLGEEFTRG